MWNLWGNYKQTAGGAGEAYCFVLLGWFLATAAF